MATAAEILVIIVSSVLAVFLILLSVSLLYFIKFLRKADNVADSVESAATAVRRSASAMPLVRLLTNLFKIRKDKKKKG